jgi:sensor histidine kinase YesM
MKKTVVFLLHSCYWSLYVLFLILLLVMLRIGAHAKADLFFRSFRLEIFFAAFALIPAILAFYLFYTLLFDHFLAKKRLVKLFFVGFWVSVCCGSVGVACMEILHYWGLSPSSTQNSWQAMFEITIFVSFIALLNGGMGLILRGFIRWYQELKVKEELTKKNFETELALVKSQLDPHFLFNSLNNIDALMLKNPEKASLYLNKLSDIMRFMLYETKGEKIPLSKEWSYIEQFIDLQKIRSANSDYVKYQKAGDTEGVVIAPMILIPFIENAFKHAEKVRVGNAINICLQVQDNALRFECHNLFKQKEKLDNTFGGLGNSLIIKRLALIYPQTHTLHVEEKDNLYSVFLNINF